MSLVMGWSFRSALLCSILAILRENSHKIMCFFHCCTWQFTKICMWLTGYFTHARMHACTLILMAIFPDEPGLAVAPLILHLFLNCASSQDRPKLSMSSIAQSLQVFFRHPLSNSFNFPRHNNVLPSHYHLYFIIIIIIYSVKSSWQNATVQ